MQRYPTPIPKRIFWKPDLLCHRTLYHKNTDLLGTRRQKRTAEAHPAWLHSWGRHLPQLQQIL